MKIVGTATSINKLPVTQVCQPCSAPRCPEAQGCCLTRWPFFLLLIRVSSASLRFLLAPASFGWVRPVLPDGSKEWAHCEMQPIMQRVAFQGFAAHAMHSAQITGYRMHGWEGACRNVSTGINTSMPIFTELMLGPSTSSWFYMPNGHTSRTPRVSRYLDWATAWDASWTFVMRIADPLCGVRPGPPKREAFRPGAPGPLLAGESGRLGEGSAISCTGGATGSGAGGGGGSGGGGGGGATFRFKQTSKIISVDKPPQKQEFILKMTWKEQLDACENNELWNIWSKKVCQLCDKTLQWALVQENGSNKHHTWSH